MLRLKLIVVGIIGFIVAFLAGVFGSRKGALEKKADILDKKTELYEKEEKKLRHKKEVLDEQIAEIEDTLGEPVPRRSPGRAAQYLRDWYRRTGRGPRR